MSSFEIIENAVRAATDRGDFDAATTHAIRGYGPEVLGFLAARLRDRTLAAEAFSIFCEDLWRGLPKFEWRSSVRVWSYTLARHAADRHAVARERQRRREAPLSPSVAQVAARVRTETLAFLKSSARDRVQALRDQLPPDDRTLLILRIDKEMSWPELAQVMTYEGEPSSDETLTREAARLRKRFQLVKERLRRMAIEEGLLEEKS